MTTKKRTTIKDDQQNWIIPKMNLTPPRPLTNTEIKETTASQCLRPDIFLTNGRHCDGCEYISLCINKLKNLPVEPKRKKRA